MHVKPVAGTRCSRHVPDARQKAAGLWIDALACAERLCGDATRESVRVAGSWCQVNGTAAGRYSYAAAAQPGIVQHDGLPGSVKLDHAHSPATPDDRIGQTIRPEQLHRAMLDQPGLHPRAQPVRLLPFSTTNEIPARSRCAVASPAGPAPTMHTTGSRRPISGNAR